ncbi:SRPBCC family protein [Paracoccus sp. TK19116]|uniref:SRPBCC family protein n=1 Tax=Paracoccus albicereus TaxID=2922394 RepID=A0ABT1MQ88_9RHOB|nr:SRPBCC family protein [Paracoccus albicereus]MCQ0970465.1 SRPBCC family protein [Paracoccus albicereus]
MSHHHHRNRNTGNGLIALGVAALAGAAAFAFYQTQGRNRVAHRPPDSAPGRLGRNGRDPYAVVGRSVLINAPRSDLYAFWRDFSNLPSFMENVRDVAVSGDVTSWSIPAPMGPVRVETRIVNDKQNEQIAWRSTEASDIETHGKVTFRDAAPGRGTEVEAVIAYVPPYGEVGRWIAKAFQKEPAIQGRRDLKRLKMLFETGEIATNHNRKK